MSASYRILSEEKRTLEKEREGEEELDKTEKYIDHSYTMEEYQYLPDSSFTYIYKKGEVEPVQKGRSDSLEK